MEVVAHETGPTRIEFSVRDSGPGISPQALDTLYAPFRDTAHGSGCLFSGTGLGLMLCHRLVQMMGSELQVESKQNWGTRFYFDLELPAPTPL